MTEPRPGMLVAVCGERYILVRCSADGVWWGGRAARQRADGTWAPSTCTFLWRVPRPFRIIEEAP